MNKKAMTIAAMGGMLMMASCASTTKAQKENGGNQQASGMEATFTEENPDPSFLILSDAQRKIVEGNNEFAFNLFSQVTDFESKVISPLSVSYLMGMLSNGANGQTLQEIMNTLGCKDVTPEEMNAFYKDLMAYSTSADKNTVLNIANYIAVNSHYQLNPSFSKNVKESYQAGVESLNFADAKSTQRINKWCSEHTGGMIPKIIDSVEPSAISYLMNAIYFNSTWKDKFDKKDTKLENFQGYTRDIKKVQMMHRNDEYSYYSNDTFSAVELPYGNGTYQMTILLPNQGKSIPDMMKTLDSKKLTSLDREMDRCIVDLKMPRFTSELELPLNDIISKLGAPSIFDAGKADFSRFCKENVFISKMLQKAKIEVSEEGTKAAAVTAAIMVAAAFNPEEPRHVEFHANRPFVYMITDRTSGSIFFIGQFTGSEI